MHWSAHLRFVETKKEDLITFFHNTTSHVIEYITQ